MTGSTATTSATVNGKKRKISVEEVADSRFNFTASDLIDDNDDDNQEDDDEDEDAIEEGDALAGPTLITTTTGLPSHLLPKSKKRGSEPGLIYLSRIPPGMGPFKVKHILAAHGEVGRVFLARSDPDPPQSSNSKKRQKEKHREHKFAEGWVEFEDKRVARSVAEMLNANPIGGKKGSRWRDDVWTMKYLPRFRWDMLSEQVALERATQTSLLRFHLQNTRTEQESYLQAVEKSRVKTAMDTKAELRREGKRAKGDTVPSQGDGIGEVKEKKKERERTYKQREAVGVKAAKKGDLDGVLNRLF